jgi:hypothetical protein
MKFIVEIRADNKTWFTADETPEPVEAEKADEVVSQLRKQGFTVRSRGENH